MDDECEHPGTWKFDTKDEPLGPGGPLEKRMALTGRDYEVKLCNCGWFHLVEVSRVEG